jgi:hypothetical protein
MGRNRVIIIGINNIFDQTRIHDGFSMNFLSDMSENRGI